MNGDRTHMLTDTVQSYGDLMLSVVPRKELGEAKSACCLCNSLLQNKH